MVLYMRKPKNALKTTKDSSKKKSYEDVRLWPAWKRGDQGATLRIAKAKGGGS